MIWILTLSNKPSYLPDAIASVAAQTRRDYVHCVAVDGPHQNASGLYAPSVWFNRMVESIPADAYLCWLSDDDLLHPEYIETLAGYLDANPAAQCCYGGAKTVRYDKETGITEELGGYPAEHRFDGTRLPLCVIDGGQFMVRRNALHWIEKPYSPESLDGANVADGNMMNKFARAFGMEPVVGSWVMTKRMTPLSGWQR